MTKDMNPSPESAGAIRSQFYIGVLRSLIAKRDTGALAEALCVAASLLRNEAGLRVEARLTPEESIQIATMLVDAGLYL